MAKAHGAICLKEGALPSKLFSPACCRDGYSLPWAWASEAASASKAESSDSMATRDCLDKALRSARSEDGIEGALLLLLLLKLPLLAGNAGGNRLLSHPW